jgi:hypothetical protein
MVAAEAAEASEGADEGGGGGECSERISEAGFNLDTATSRTGRADWGEGREASVLDMRDWIDDRFWARTAARCGLSGMGMGAFIAADVVVDVVDVLGCGSVGAVIVCA